MQAARVLSTKPSKSVQMRAEGGVALGFIKTLAIGRLSKFRPVIVKILQRKRC